MRWETEEFHSAAQKRQIIDYYYNSNLENNFDSVVKFNVNLLHLN